jgi:hypothetical protein
MTWDRLGKAPKHPSGRPRARESYGRLSITRSPSREPLTPGLRKREGMTEAIGFVVPSDYGHDDED